VSLLILVCDSGRGYDGLERFVRQETLRRLDESGQ
jgi:hypothetical protein